MLVPTSLNILYNQCLSYDVGHHTNWYVKKYIYLGSIINIIWLHNRTCDQWSVCAHPSITCLLDHYLILPTHSLFSSVTRSWLPIWVSEMVLQICLSSLFTLFAVGWTLATFCLLIGAHRPSPPHTCSSLMEFGSQLQQRYYLLLYPAVSTAPTIPLQQYNKAFDTLMGTILKEDLPGCMTPISYGLLLLLLTMFT